MNDKIKLLTETKKIIEKGWVQGKFSTNASGEWCSHLSNDVEACCLKGAFNKAGKELNLFSTANNISDKLYDKLPKVTSGLCPIVFWNDDPKRTKEEVIQLLDEMIKEYEVCCM